MIEVKNVSKKYGKHVALDDLNLSIETGKIYGLLGENGAGKSTTMNIITGYLAPTTGEVLIDDFDILKKPQKAKEKIGYLPEMPPLYQDMTVEEYLKFVARLKGISRKDCKNAVKVALEKTKTVDVKKRLIKNLSKGYKQRVGIAQAILGSPEIVILDEPTVGLDPVQITEIRELIREIGKEHTVILSSHILSEISEVCDHVFMISHGKLVLDEDMDKIDSLENVFIELAQSAENAVEQEESVLTEELDSLEESVLPEEPTLSEKTETSEENSLRLENDIREENTSVEKIEDLEIISLDDKKEAEEMENEDKKSRRKRERKKKYKKNKTENKEDEE